MKRNYTFFKSLLLLCTVLLGGVSSAWADGTTYSITKEVIGIGDFTISLDYDDLDDLSLDDLTSVEENTTVTLTEEETDENYKFILFEVLKSDGTKVPVSNNEFTMPACDVTVKAYFVTDISNITIDGNNYTVGGTVVAKNEDGFVIDDGSGMIYCDKKGREKEMPSVFDVNIKVIISGNIEQENSFIHFTPDFEIKTIPDLSLPHVEIFTPFENYYETFKRVYYSLSEHVGFSGTFQKDDEDNIFIEIKVGNNETIKAYFSDPDSSSPTDEIDNIRDYIEEFNDPDSEDEKYEVDGTGYITNITVDENEELEVYLILSRIDKASSGFQLVPITSAKWATYCWKENLDFSGTGITVYKAKGDLNNNVVRLTRIDGIVPKETGVILYKNVTEPIEYTPVNVKETTEDGSTNWEDNEMVGTTEETPVKYESGDKVNYILQTSNTSTNGVVFNKAKASGVYNMPPYHAYLSTDKPTSAGSGARLRVVIEDELSGIRTIEEAPFTFDQTMYDLQGRRVDSAKKGGIYVVNGKKYIAN